MSDNNTASAPATADRATCPTCGRPISAPLGQGTGPRSGARATGLPVSSQDGGSLASAATAPGIAALRPNSEASLEATVASVGPTREVDTSRGPSEVADAVLQDPTGTVKLVLWGPQIARVQAGQRVRLAGAWVKEYRGKLQLSLGRNASMAVLGP